MTTSTPLRRAVVIEDDAEIRTLLQTILTQGGFDVRVAENGEAGLDVVEEFAPIVAIVDVNMPGIDGFATARKIRERGDTYIIILTALGDEIDVIEGLNSGADDYITKPFRPRELRARIEALLRRPRATGLEPEAEDGSVEASAADADPAEQPDALPEPLPEPASAEEQEPAAAYPPVAEPERSPSFPQEQVPAWYPVPTAQPYAPPQAYPPAQPYHGQQPYPVQPQQPYPPHPGYVAVPVQEGYPGQPAQSAPPVQQLAPEQVAPPAAPGTDDWIQFKGLHLSPSRRLVFVNENPIDLTRTEFDLLYSLLSTGRRVRSKADLALMLHGESYVTTYLVSDSDKRAVEVHISNLRRKIGDTGASAKWIETVRGIGYRLASERD